VANQTVGFTARILHERSGLYSYDQAGFVYDQSGATYDNNPAYIRRFSAQAYLIALGQAIRIKAAISQSAGHTLNIRAKINPRGSWTLNVQARVKKYGYSDLQLHARLTQLHQESINLQARVSHYHTSELHIKANLRLAHQFSAQCRVLRYEHRDLIGQARILKYFNWELSAQASLVRRQSFQTQTRIQNIYTPNLQVRTRISQRRLKAIWIRGKIWPYSRLKLRARIKDVSWKRRYVNTLAKPTIQNSIPGRGDVLIHTNGNTYCVFSDTYSNAVAQRRLYLVISTDGGLTWGSRITLTTGYWDNMPSLLQLDLTSTSSDIGLAFVRGAVRTIYRLSFDVTGTVTWGPAIIYTGTATQNNAYPQLIKTVAGKFRILCLGDNAAKAISIYESATFNNASNWTITGYFYPGGQSSGAKTLTSLSVRRHANSGHLFALVTYASIYNGGDTDFQYLGTNWVLNLGICFSTNEGSTWTAIQSMATNAWDGSIDLAPHASPLAADFAELSDGSVGILYQEGNTHQIINSNTIPELNSQTYVRTAGVIYDSLRDTLIVAEHCAASAYYVDSTTEGGIIFFDRSASGVFEEGFRLAVRSTPPIWTHDINNISQSPDGRYLAIATNIGLTLVDMQNPDRAQWVIQEFRKSTSTIMLANKIQDVQWLSNTTLVFGYGESSLLAYNWGGKFDVTDPTGTFVALYNNGDSSPSLYSRITVVNNVLFFLTNASKILACDATTGVALGNFSITNMSYYAIGYDAINDEFLVGSNTLLYFLKYNWITHTFSQLQTINVSTSNPRLYGPPQRFFTVGDNVGMLTTSDYSVMFYNPDSKVLLGAMVESERTMGMGIYPGDSFYYGTHVVDVKGTQWLVSGGDSKGLWFAPIDNSGKLRYGVFTYDQTAKQLYEGDAAFYDIVSPRTVNAADYNQMEFPRVVARADGALVIYTRFCDMARRTQPFAPVITLGWTDGMTITAKARLLLPTSLLFRASIIDTKPKLYVRGHIWRNMVPTFTSKAWIRSSGHVTFRATLLKGQTRTLNVHGRILTHKTSTVAVKGRLVRLRGISVQAHLIPLRRVSVRAKICFPRSKTITAKAHIHILSRPTIQMHARIKGGPVWTLNSQARIIHGSAWEIKARLSQQQGWPIPTGYDDQTYVFTDTSLYMRGRIGEAILYESTIGLRTRIYPVKIVSLSGQAHLISGQSMQMRANIKPWRKYVHLPCTYRVQFVGKKRLRMVFYMHGNYQTAQVGVGARITWKAQTRFTGHFIVPMPTSLESIMTLETSNNLSYGQMFGTKAFITRAY
jgi:hypothetical protein